MRKIIVVVIALVIIAGAVFGAKYLIDNKKAPEKKTTKEIKIVETDTIQNSTVEITIPSNGNLQAKRRVELYSEVTGVFQNTGKLFRAGQEYRKGETLISINNQEFYAQVQSARSDLNNQITAIMPDLRLDYPESFQQWQDYLNNWNQTSYTPALPEPVNDKEKYFITGRNIYSTFFSLKNLENRLRKFAIRAPFNGILTEAMVSEGTLVRNGQQLGEFIQKGTYEMNVAISAEFADLLKLGETVTLTNVTGTKTYEGEVTRINGKVDQATQTITTVIEVSDPSLKEGMYLSAKLKAQKVANAVELDRELLQDNNQIFSVRDEKLKLINVTLIHFSEETMVLKGIEDKTVIISKTVPGAYEGMLVKPEGSEDVKADSGDASSFISPSNRAKVVKLNQNETSNSGTQQQS
ncbi:MAG: HlyD family efflux transporter periplasmic adaptor subunit [Nonlabens sp.]